MEYPAEIGPLVAQGRQLQRTQRFEEALDCFDAALKLDPRHLEALGNRGGTLGALGRFAEALRDFEAALLLAPGHPALLYNRANALRHLERLEEALESYDAALAVDPGRIEGWLNRGTVLRSLKRTDMALASFDKVLALKPDHAGAFCNRGDIKWVEGKNVEAALADFERAFAIDPGIDNLIGDLLHLRMHVGDWRDYQAQKIQTDAAVRAGRRAIGPFAYQAISESPADLMACSRMRAADRDPPRPALATGPYRHGKIRIGYLCGEFREQATSLLIAGLYEQHDKSQFTLTAFDSGRSDGSVMRKRLQSAFDRFETIAELSDAEAANRIAAQEIDILVNLNGYFGEDRMGVFARRPAPIQVNYLGFPATLGAPYMDYIIADKTVIPPGEQRFYTEKVVTLPDSYQANDRGRAIAAQVPSRAACGLPQRGLVFCNFNQSYKLTPLVFAAWMRILGQVPGSVLWLLENNTQFAENMRRHAEAAGIAAMRLVFAPMIAPPLHLARIGLADLFVDTMPYNAHTTASDALWAGVPLVTCRGTTFPGRVGASLLNAIGLPELVTEDLKSYEALTARLARDPDALQALRKKLEANRLTTALFDTVRFTRHLEAAYRTMQDMALRGASPESFAVTALA